MFLDNKYKIQEKVITVPKKPLFLVLPYLGPLSLQTRTKLRKSLKAILNYCKLHIVSKSQNKLAKAFVLKIVFPRNLHRFTENKCISCNNQNKLYFLHLIDILNDLLLTCRIRTSWLQRSLFIETIHHWIHCSLYCRSYKPKSIIMLSDQ